MSQQQGMVLPLDGDGWLKGCLDCIVLVPPASGGLQAHPPTPFPTLRNALASHHLLPPDASTPTSPRVDHIFLVSGNRAELLIKCEGQPGDRFIVASGAMLSPFGRASFTGTSTASTPLEQEVVMTIELAAAEVGRWGGWGGAERHDCSMDRA